MKLDTDKCQYNHIYRYLFFFELNVYIFILIVYLFLKFHIFPYYFTDIYRLHVYTSTTNESNYCRQCDQLRGNKHYLQHIVLLFMALYRSSILQHVYNLSLHNARTFCDTSRCSRRSKIVCLRYTMDQSQNFRHNTSTYGVRCSYR